MFGYVVANYAQLTPEQTARYRGCYCGLCRTLGQRYGLRGRAALTYDMTFLVLLLSSLYEPEETHGTERCALHPAKPHGYWYSEITDYAADMNLALAYYSCLDNWRDDHSLPHLAEARLLEKKCVALRSRYPRQMRAIEYGLSRLAALEREKSSDLDAAAGCFGTLMGELFVLREDRWSVPLRRMGAALGSFLYVLDAYDDLEKDRRRGSYNPLLARQGEDLPARCREILTMLIAEAAAEFEKLPLVEDAALLRNILYSGVWTRFLQIEARANKRAGGKGGGQ